MSATVEPCFVEFERRFSGPAYSADGAPFTSGAVDLAFVCTPTLSWFERLETPPGVVIGAAPLFDDARLEVPGYFSEVVVRSGGAPPSWNQLAGVQWGFNDERSASGCLNVLAALTPEHATAFADSAIRTGSHVSSLRALRKGDIEVAAIDSNALAHFRSAHPRLTEGVQIAHSLGPFPMQPLVAATRLGADFHDRVAESLLDPSWWDGLGVYSVSGFAKVDADEYHREAARLGRFAAIMNR